MRIDPDEVVSLHNRKSTLASDTVGERIIMSKPTRHNSRLRIVMTLTATVILAGFWSIWMLSFFGSIRFDRPVGLNGTSWPSTYRVTLTGGSMCLTIGTFGPVEKMPADPLLVPAYSTTGFREFLPGLGLNEWNDPIEISSNRPNEALFRYMKHREFSIGFYWLTSTLVALATMIWLIGVRPFVIRVRRLQYNQCLTCGYSRRGIGHAVCPECGTESKSAAHSTPRDG